MPMYRPIRQLVPIVTLSVLVSAAEGGAFRWVDDDGQVHYTDTIPPAQVRKGHIELSKEGVRIDNVPPVKTAEEIQEENELVRWRAETQRIVEEQEAADRTLLRTFRSEDDVIMARDGKIASIDVMIHVTKNNIRRQQEALTRLRKEAADLERAGKTVHAHLQDRIALTERSIRDAYAIILDRETKKHSIHEEFVRHLARFRQLKNLPQQGTPGETKDTRPVLHNLVTCSGSLECDRLWARAEAYVREHATTTVQTSGANILVSTLPAKGANISLILSRINDTGGQGTSLFLDLQCDKSPSGRKMCQSPEVRAVIKGFRPTMTGED